MADNEAITLCEGELTLSSPPKPTRIIQIENIATPQRQHFVQNTFSLPEHAGEAAVAKKIQVLRLEKRIEFWGKITGIFRNMSLDVSLKNFTMTYFVFLHIG